MEKRWTLTQTNEQQCLRLHEGLGIRPIYCQLLIQRGIHTFEEAKAFFRPHQNTLPDPFEMKGMKKAVTRIEKAINEKENILVYGDYDVDGTTAIATVYSFLHKQYPLLSIDYYAPDRYKEGYGLSKTGIDYAQSQKIHLLIVLDCGIKANKEIAYAQSLGIDVIVCDHHLPGEQLPEAYALLNPKQKSCPYPYKELSGCGIGFKLICALAQHLRKSKETAFRYLDLVATSTAADIVPMTQENRTLTYLGLKKINEHPLPAIKALITVSRLQLPINIKDVLFMIAPRINAAGRLKHARLAIDLLVEEDEEKALSLAQELQALNDERKSLDKEISEEILNKIAHSSVLQKRKTTVMFGKQWHKGVIGIAASRVMETHYKPTVIFSQHKGKVTGSARSVKGFNIYKALKACSPFMDSFGGHQFAAGMTLKPKTFEAFSEKFEEIVASSIPPEMLIPEIKIDAEITFGDITEKFYQLLAQFEPFGPENEYPVFLLRGVKDNGYSKILKTKHIRFEIIHSACPGKTLTGIGFNLAHKFDIIASGIPFNLCFHLEKNNFNGQSKLQLRVIDLKN